MAQVFKLERRRTNTSSAVIEAEVVYGISSLGRREASAKRLLQATRDYWGIEIENGLHYRRDRTLREDDTRITDNTQAEAMAILNNLIINLIIGLILRQGWPYLPEARRHYEAHFDAAVRLVLTQPD